MRFSLNPDIQVLPEVWAIIDDLPAVLVLGGYKANIENALKMAEDLKDFIYEIPRTLHHRIKPQFAHHFVRYGNPTHYAFFKRKSSPNTTWYIFFSKKGKRILVKHIATNWTEGQYIR